MGRVIHLHVHETDIQIPDASGQFCANQNINWLSGRAQANAARIEWQRPIRVVEIEERCVVKEEVAFLRKEKREPRQIYLADISFRFGKVGIHREGRRECRSDPVEHIQTWFQIKSSITVA